MLTKEKEDLIRKLLSEGRTYREITKIVHCSPNEIALVQRKIKGENTEDSLNMKNKSICSQALDLFQRGVPLIQVIIILDIEPELGKKYQDIYLSLLKREKIVSMLKDDKDILLKIDILEFLQENPQLYRKIKEAIDIQYVIWELMAERNEAKDDLNNTNFLYSHADSRLQKLNKKLRLMEENQLENNYLYY
jgi:hypothetical protein